MEEYNIFFSTPDIPAEFEMLGTVSFIGRGSTSSVYKIEGEETFALKIIECAHNESKSRNALHEIEVMKHLNGVDNVIRMYQSKGVMDDLDRHTVYILEEYCVPITEYLMQKKVSVAEAIRIVMGVCDALIGCRNAGVLHLDVQPKNIFVGQQGNVKLGDFSSSLFAEELAENCKMRGTLAYMAPEVYRKGVCSEQSEIYSVGLVLYALFNMLTLPFMNYSDMEGAVMKRLAGTAFPELQDLEEGLKTWVEAIVREACEFEPERRIRTFELLKARLTDIYEKVSGTAVGEASLLGSNSYMELSWGDTAVDENDAYRRAPSTATGGASWDADSVATTATFWDADPMAESVVCWDADAVATSVALRPNVVAPVIPVPRCRVCDSPLSQNANFCQYCGSKVQTEKPALELKKVQFSAVAPKEFVKGEYTIIDIVMYEEAFRHVVDELLRDAAEAGTPARETKSGVLKVQENAMVKICLTSPDMEIADNEEAREWQGDYLDFNFAVLLPENYGKKQVLFCANVLVNDVIATRLKFTVKCVSSCEQNPTVTREDILSAFVSYASQDRVRVARIIQGMKRVRPDMDIFFDIESLRSGDDWEEVLQQEIKKRDIMFLCWSQFARESKWVDAEWRYALEHKGVESIEPVPLEPPAECPPPEELVRKHFNDRLLYVINAMKEMKNHMDTDFCGDEW